MEEDIEKGLIVKEKKEETVGCTLPEWCGVSMALLNVGFFLLLLIAVILGICKFNGVI